MSPPTTVAVQSGRAHYAHRPQRPQSPRPNTVTLETSVMLHDDGLHSALHRAPPPSTPSAMPERCRKRRPPTQPSAKWSCYGPDWAPCRKRARTQEPARQPVQLRPGDCQRLQPRHGRKPSPPRRARRRPQARRPTRPLRGEPGQGQSQAPQSLATRRGQAPGQRRLHRSRHPRQTHGRQVAAPLRRLGRRVQRPSRTLTEHHFKPFIVYEIRYTPIGAPPATVDEDGNAASPPRKSTRCRSRSTSPTKAGPSWSTPSTTTPTPTSSLWRSP